MRREEENKWTYKDDLKEHFLINLHKLLVPFLDIGRLFTTVGVVILGSGRVVLVMLAPLDNFLEDLLIDLRRNVLVGPSLPGQPDDGVLTLGIGTAVSWAPSPRSSIIFLMSMERSATLRSAGVCISFSVRRKGARSTTYWLRWGCHHWTVG